MPAQPQGVIARWGDRLTLPPSAPRISLGEGDTPCVESLTVGPALGLGSLHFKLEGLNPTGSFKDRGMVVAVAAALQAGSRAIICASTGNTSASAAAQSFARICPQARFLVVYRRADSVVRAIIGSSPGRTSWNCTGAAVARFTSLPSTAKKFVWRSYRPALS